MADKYIIIPEYKPLYAMRYCFGPTHGPLEKPCPTPIDVIGKLLLQTGNEKLNIYEVKIDPTTRKTIGEPVKLTLSNYKKSYDEIVSGNVKNITVGSILVIDADPKPVVFHPVKKDNITEASESVAPKKEETLVETTLEERLANIPEEDPDEFDKTMIQEAEKENINSDPINLEDVKDSFNEELVASTTFTVTTSSSDSTYESSSVVYTEPEVPINGTPFITGMSIDSDNEIIPEYTTTSTSDSYVVSVTTSDGTKMVDTGMTEAEYKALSKSDRRRLRKKLAEDFSTEEISDNEANEIENNTPM